MNKKIKNKESLVQEIGMRYDEAVALFSDETLESMAMNNILGGNNKDGCTQNGCTKDSADNDKNCVQNGCTGVTSGNPGGSSTGSGSGSGSNKTATIITAVGSALLGIASVISAFKK